MLISKIAASGVMAISLVEIDTRTPITLICGGNEVGKSSIAEAIKHAFTGESTRVTLKKDYKHLVNDKNTVGYTYVEYDGGQKACITLPNGAHELTGKVPELIEYVLDPDLFSRLSEDDRRRLIIKLSGVKSNADSIVEKLLARECDSAKVEQIKPFLQSGFTAAHNQAKEYCKEAKQSWRTTTGETYGEKKAEGWEAVAPEVDLAAKRSAESELAGIDKELEEANQQLGSVQEKIDAAKQQAEPLKNLREQASKVDRIRSKLEIDRKESAQLAIQLTEARNAALASKPDAVATQCPCCNAELIFADGKLLERQGELHGDEVAAVKLPDLERALALLNNSVAYGDRDLAVAVAAKDQLDAMARTDNEAPSEDKLIALANRVALLKANRKQLNDQLEAINKNARAAAESETKTQSAAKYHADALAWDKIAEALSPSGIQSELMADAIKPINDRLAQSTRLSGWKSVVITEDMGIVYDGRPHSLSSASAKWRTNAMIAEAISHLAGIKFLMLDEFDILSLEGRGQLIGWLTKVVGAGEIDSVIVLGTLKALPSGLPASMSAYWLEDGVILLDREEAA